MTQEEKQLLLVDLCARVPYITFVYVDWHETEKLDICEGCEDEKEEPNIHTLISCDYYGECDLDNNLYKTIYDIKPYLRPMSSMTEEERKELQEIAVALSYNKDDIMIGTQINSFRQLDGVLDLFNSHHFDYRGLIEKGLAIEAPKGMYK